MEDKFILEINKAGTKALAIFEYYHTRKKLDLTIPLIGKPDDHLREYTEERLRRHSYDYLDRFMDWLD